MVNQIRATDAPLPYLIANLPGQGGLTAHIWLHPDPRFCSDLTKLSAWEREYLSFLLKAIGKRLAEADQSTMEDGPWND